MTITIAVIWDVTPCNLA